VFENIYNLNLLLVYMKKDLRFLWVLEVLITILAILHLGRAVMGGPLIVGGFEVPIWLSYVAFLVWGYLSYRLFIFLRK